jgi:hypothetical protein
LLIPLQEIPRLSLFSSNFATFSLYFSMFPTSHTLFFSINFLIAITRSYTLFNANLVKDNKNFFEISLLPFFEAKLSAL